MNSDKAIKLLEYITKICDVVLSDHSMTSILYPTDKIIHIEDTSLDRIIERFCMELLKYTGEQFKKGLKEILDGR